MGSVPERAGRRISPSTELQTDDGQQLRKQAERHAGDSRSLDPADL
jgi:hypothetical protein